MMLSKKSIPWALGKQIDVPQLVPCINLCALASRICIQQLAPHPEAEALSAHLSPTCGTFVGSLW